MHICLTWLLTASKTSSLSERPSPDDALSCRWSPSEPDDDISSPSVLLSAAPSSCSSAAELLLCVVSSTIYNVQYLVSQHQCRRQREAEDAISLCSAHGPILGTAEGISSEQANLIGSGTARWCEGDPAVCASLKRVESLLGRQMPRKKLLWVVCYLTYRQRSQTVKDGANKLSTGYSGGSIGINFGICNEVRSLDAE